MGWSTFTKEKMCTYKNISIKGGMVIQVGWSYRWDGRFIYDYNDRV